MIENPFDANSFMVLHDVPKLPYNILYSVWEYRLLETISINKATIIDFIIDRFSVNILYLKQKGGTIRYLLEFRLPPSDLIANKHE